MIARLFNAAKYDPFDVWPVEVVSIVRSSRVGGAVSALNALIFFVGSYGRVDLSVAAIWLTASLALFAWIGFRAHQARSLTVKRVSRRAVRRMALFAALFAAPWAALSVLYIGFSLFDVEVVVLMVCAGMSAGGAFMLHRAPIAAMIYIATILLPVMLCSLRQPLLHWPIALYTIPFGGFLISTMFNVWRMSREREDSLHMAKSALDDLTGAHVELKRMRDEAEQEALIDPLTGLYNRRGLERELRQRMEQGLATGEGVAALHIDLDRFKEINDKHGHAAGDHVLTHVGAELRDKTRHGDFVARIGGDEFVVLCRAKGAHAGLRELGQRIVAALSKPINFEGATCAIGASIGVDVISAGDVGDDPLRLLVNADIALYRAKEAGRGRVEFFNDELRREVLRAKALGDNLADALRRDELEAFFQPQVSVATGEVVAVEALARWRHPELGLLTPETFMPVAERMKLTHAVDDAILRKGLTATEKWAARGISPPQLAVNVSAQRLEDPTLLQQLSMIEAPRSAVVFELQEGLLLEDTGETAQRLARQLETLGVDVEIGNFGVGGASLNCLLSLRPKRIKITRELVARLLSSEAHQEQIQAIVHVAAALGIETTAEGVENKAQADLLTEMGCHRLQGFYFGRPVTADALFEILFAQDQAAAHRA
ncbi:MAG: EAL domain-containing protein [Neomegalonema sp.]|nr:EAL domain-containing protein [Neomegalonema sp.]